MSVTDTRLITTVQAAEIIGLSRSKLYELLASRELPSVRIGRARRIDLQDLERFIDGHRVPNAPLTTPSRDLWPPTTRFADEDHQWQHGSPTPAPPHRFWLRPLRPTNPDRPHIPIGPLTSSLWRA